MERDAILSHGMGAFIRDRMYFCADKYQVNICKKCGKIAAYNEAKSIYRCMMCDNRTNFALVQVPYAFKLLSQELESMNIVPRLITE
jgi:DNA-directed RNA polymerase beta subunit